MKRFKEFIREGVIAPDDPVRHEYNGGIPEYGGYGHGTEYEIGAQEVCGGLINTINSIKVVIINLDQDNYDLAKLEYINLKKYSNQLVATIDKYASPVYNKIISTIHEPDIKASIKRIQKNSPELEKIAKSKSLLLNPIDYPTAAHKSAYNSVKLCYALLQSFSREIGKSVKHYPEEVSNVFEMMKHSDYYKVIKKHNKVLFKKLKQLKKP